jgi:hypothetical protein
MFNFADNATKRDSIIEVFQMLVDKSDVNIACYSTKVKYYLDKLYFFNGRFLFNMDLWYVSSYIKHSCTLNVTVISVNPL